MDFVIIPSNRASFGLPQVKGRSWMGALALIQAVYLIVYAVVDREYFRLLDDPFTCSASCVSPNLVVLLDWFLSSATILVPMITDELLIFDDFLYFAYHYIFFVRVFLLYRIGLFLFLLPAQGLPVWAVVVVEFFHICVILTILRIFYVLLKEIEKSKTSLIAIQFTFTRFTSVVLTKVYRGIEGESMSVAPAMKISLADNCPICFEGLSIPISRQQTSLTKTRRFNTTANRPLAHGKLNIFTTACNHSFHRDCLMRWISGKPIRVQLGLNGESAELGGNATYVGRRTGASCPVCGRKIKLKLARTTKWLFEFIWNRQL